MIKTGIPPKKIRGQSRILETVIASVIIFVVFSAATFLIQASNTHVLQDRENLDTTGYNVLNKLVESKTIEHSIDDNTQNVENNLKAFLHRTLPSNIYHNLTIKQYSIENTWTTPTTLVSVSNVDSQELAKAIEISSTPMLYTSTKGNIYHLTLTLARGGISNTQ